MRVVRNTAGAAWALAVIVHAGILHADGAPCKELKVDGAGGQPVTATTTVFLDSRFSGFALRDASGASRPFGVLERAGGRISFFFNARAGEALQLLPAADAKLPSEREWPERTSGLLHAARTYDGSAIQSRDQFEAAWSRAPAQGAGFVAQVYFAYNPCGPNSNTLHRYEGFLNVQAPGEYVFCTASTDASFLLINGREIAAWPGRHPAKVGLDGSKRGSVTLQSGLYAFTYLHANCGSESTAIAAFIPPGEKRHTVIGPEAFTPAAFAFVGPLTGGDGAPEFLWENRHMVNLREHALYDLAFEAARPKGAPAATYEWDFGDGARGAGEKAEHCYFSAGERAVTLTADYGGGRRASCTQTVRISPRYGQSENDDARTLSLLDRAARQEREAGIEPPGYALIALGYLFYLKEEQAAAFAERAVAALARIPAEDVAPLFGELALSVQQVGEQYELAERCFRAILARGADARAKAAAALHYGGMLNLCLNRPQDARATLASITRSDLADWEQRLLDIYLADTALVLDDAAAARRLYQAVPKPTAVVTGSRLDRLALFDYNTRYFRLQNLLSQQLYREALGELDMLEWEIPEERASPHTNLLKVRALAGNGQPKKAIVCLQRALKADVDETTAPALRLELAKLHLQLGQLAQAKRQIDVIRKEWPWTQEEIEARKLLEELDRKLGSEGSGQQPAGAAP